VAEPAPSRRVPFSWPALFAAGIVVYLLFRIHAVLIPFVLSFALAYLVDPLIHNFEARGLKREHIVLTLYLVIAVAIGVAANFLLPAMTSELSLLQGRAASYYTGIQDTFAKLQAEVAQRLPWGRHIVEKMSLKMYNPLMEHLPKLPTYILGLVPLFSLLFLVPFITFFMLMDSKKFMQQAIDRCPGRHVEQVLHISSEIDTSLGNYLRGIMITAGIIGAASYLGLLALEVDYALAIAALSGVSSFIPYVGAIVGALAGGLVAFFQYHGFAAPLKVVALFTCIRLADEALVQPLISRHAMHLHPMVFLLALMVGGKLFGFIGLLFGVPAACVIKALIGVAWDYYTSQTQAAGHLSPEGVEVPYI